MTLSEVITKDKTYQEERDKLRLAINERVAALKVMVDEHYNKDLKGKK